MITCFEFRARASPPRFDFFLQRKDQPFIENVGKDLLYLKFPDFSTTTNN